MSKRGGRKVVQRGTGRSADEKRSCSLQVFDSSRLIQLIQLQREQGDGTSGPITGDTAGASALLGSAKTGGLNPAGSFSH